MKTEAKREMCMSKMCMSEAERKHGPLVPGKKTYPVSELQKMVWEVLVIFPSYDQKTALEVKQRTN